MFLLVCSCIRPTCSVASVDLLVKTTTIPLHRVGRNLALYKDCFFRGLPIRTKSSTMDLSLPMFEIAIKYDVEPGGLLECAFRNKLFALAHVHECAPATRANLQLLLRDPV